MTAQAHDHVTFRGRDYLLVGVDGGELFHLFDQGIVTQATTTANWRGWVAGYEIQGDRLTLKELHDVGLVTAPGEPLPVLRGVAARREGGASFSFPELNWPLDFTGRLIIARGFIQSLYRHMGFHPAWKFEESWELEVDGGSVTSARDMTAEMTDLRKKIQAGKLLDPDTESVPGWIERTFRLDFWRSKGN
jgi:hypothetical protein